MKKILTILITVVLMMSFAFTTVFAGTFINSPSLTDEIKFEIVDDGGTGETVKLTEYKDKTSLSEIRLTEITEAYNIIDNAKNVSEFCPEITEENVGVSNLFDISVEFNDTGDLPEGDYVFTVKLESETFENFVNLIHYKDGKFEVVEHVVNDGNTLTVTLTDCSPFAVVVSTEEDVSTTDGIAIIMATIVTAICACVLAVVCVAYKKRSK